MKTCKCPRCSEVFLGEGNFCNKCAEEEARFRSEQDALEGQARAEAEAEDRGKWEEEQHEQAEYEQSHGPEG